MCPLIHTHGSVGVSVLIDGDARVKNWSGALIFSESQSSPYNFNRSYLCEISGSEAPVFHGYIYMTRSVETRRFFSPFLLAQVTLRDGRPFRRSRPRVSLSSFLILHHYPTSTQPLHKPPSTPITHTIFPPSTTNT